MEYENFITQIRHELAEAYEPIASVYISHTLRNNDVIMDSVTIKRHGINIAPTIHLTPYYSRYLEGIPFDEIITDIKDTYEMTKLHEDFDTSIYTDYEKAKSQICMRLISFDRNKTLLEDLPHIRYLDLAIVFAFVIPQEMELCASILIHKEHLLLWGITTDELYAQAQKSAPLVQPPFLESLPKVTQIPEEDFEVPLLILSNSSRVHGASTLAYPNLLKEIADLFESDLTIIPSSIHEVLLVPETHLSHYALDELIQDVNELELHTSEILSDHAYYYYRDQGKLTM